MNKIVCLAALSLSLCGEEVALISKEDAGIPRLGRLQVI